MKGYLSLFLLNKRTLKKCKSKKKCIVYKTECVCVKQTAVTVPKSRVLPFPELP